MMKKQKYNLTAKQILEKQLKRGELFQKKEKVYLKSPWRGYCDNNEHPLFTINVTEQRPLSACYYCSKVYILEKE
jgi:hypothetical protein